VPDFPSSKPVLLSEVSETAAERVSCGIAEFDRVMGGGVVSASAVLLGGDPGIGKSTILLQAARGLARRGKTVLYVSGEESEAQVKLRASRLGIADGGIWLMWETSLERILSAASELSPAAMIVDSIQTVFSSDLAGAPGSVGRCGSARRVWSSSARRRGSRSSSWGTCTKEGRDRGPAGSSSTSSTRFSISRGEGTSRTASSKAVKNRFRLDNEIGVFEMRAEGLTEVAVPSGCSCRSGPAKPPGRSSSRRYEGTRPLLVEIQALVSRSFLPVPRRTTLGSTSTA
jgi:DNA repair protein RadA/Sms